MPRNSMTKLAKKTQKPLELRGYASKIVIEFRPAEIRVERYATENIGMAELGTVTK
jgi:hypothetical protein